jgi:hypothetical protein
MSLNENAQIDTGQVEDRRGASGGGLGGMIPIGGGGRGGIIATVILLLAGNSLGG